MLNISTQEHDSIFVLALEGKLLASAESLLWDAVQDVVVRQGGRKVVLNFDKLKECDSYGIGELLRLQRSIENIGGKMILVGLNPLIRKVFMITKVDTVFHIETDKAAALHGFSNAAS